MNQKNNLDWDYIKKNKMEIKEFIKDILGVELNEFQEELLKKEGILKFYPIRKHGKYN